MRVTCPSCGARFKVPDKALGEAGRKLKCGKCEHQWFQKAPTPDELAAGADAVEKTNAQSKDAPKSDPASEPEPAVAEAIPSEDDDLPPHPEREEPGRAEDDLEPPPIGDVSRFRPRNRDRADGKQRPVALYLLLATAVLIPTILFGGRASLVEAWPPLALLYDSVGLHVPVEGEGLELRNVFAQRRTEGSIEILVVAGEIRNPTESLKSLPAMRGAVLDGQGQELEEWLFTADSQLLPPGETIAFTSEFAAPPAGAVQVNVTFTGDRPASGLGY